MDKLEEAVLELRAMGLVANAMAMDVSDIAATQVSVRASGPFDILVNSAGAALHSLAIDTTEDDYDVVAGLNIKGAYSLAIDTTEDDYDVVAGLNIKGAYFLTTAVAKGLVKARRPGSLINVSSQLVLKSLLPRVRWTS